MDIKILLQIQNRPIENMFITLNNLHTYSIFLITAALPYEFRRKHVNKTYGNTMYT